MTQIEQIGETKIQFMVDTSIYKDTVISKVLYWLSDMYLIHRYSSDDRKQIIELERKSGTLTTEDFIQLKTKINQDFIDYKTRDIVNSETKNIRNILYIKAFSNGDDFEDYNLIAD